MTMNTKSIFVLSFFLLFFISKISAQVAASIKNDKDITWIGETEFTYHLENHTRMNFTPEGSSQEETRLIKIDPVATCQYGNEKFLTNYLMSGIDDGKLKTYNKDGKLLNSDDIYDQMGSSHIDTVITFDPETLDETFSVVRTDPISKIGAFKIKQWWYYNKSTESFQSTVKYIAPLIEKLDKEGNVLGYKFLFWIDVAQQPGEDFNFNQANIVWAKETINTVSFKDIEKIKGNTRKTFKNLAFQNPKKGKSQVLENESWYAYCSDPISTNEVNQLLSASKDSVVVYDPETYEESIVIVKKPKVKFKDLNFYRVHQHWYFDIEKNQLASKLITIGPLQEFHNEKGDLKYRRALYYIQGEKEQD